LLPPAIRRRFKRINLNILYPYNFVLKRIGLSGGGESGPIISRGYIVP
jgi:hypothetical protein